MAQSNPRSNNSYHQPRISDTDRIYFRKIFDLESKDRRGESINFAGLKRIFEMVGFEPNSK